MARRKLKLTPFARFFIFILFAAPIAYLGASYFNGEDGFQNIKDLLGIDSSPEREITEGMPAPVQANDTATLDCEEMKDRFDSLEAQVEKLRADNLRLMEDLEAKKKELLELQSQDATGAAPQIQ